MNMRSAHIKTLAIYLVSTPLLMGAGCPGEQTRAHEGSWVSQGDQHVMLYQFERGGAARFAFESYSPNPLFDGMKLEITATCKHDSDGESFEDGSYELTCEDARLVRGTQGIALLHDLGQLTSSYLAPGASDGTKPVKPFNVRLKKEGDDLIAYHEDRETKELTRTALEPVTPERAERWLERFHEDTVELKEVTSSRRARDLP